MKHNKVRLWGTATLTTLSITLVLFVFGMLILLEYHSYRLTQDAQERITYKVDLVPDVDSASVKLIMAEIEKTPYVKQFDYISKDEAAEIFSADIGEDFVNFIGYNPLYPSIMVNFHADLLPANASQFLDQFCKKMNHFPAVTGVNYQEVVVSELFSIFNKLTWFLIIFIALLLIACVLMIRSTILIALYSQRDTISTMRLVGATTHFISRPFLWRSALYGALGGLFADILIIISAYVFNKQLNLSIIYDSHIFWYALIALGIIIVGMVISWISTAIAIRRHLRHDSLK